MSYRIVHDFDREPSVVIRRYDDLSVAIADAHKISKQAANTWAEVVNEEGRVFWSSRPKVFDVEALKTWLEERISAANRGGLFQIAYRYVLQHIIELEAADDQRAP